MSAASAVACSGRRSMKTSVGRRIVVLGSFDPAHRSVKEQIAAFGYIHTAFFYIVVGSRLEFYALQFSFHHGDRNKGCYKSDDQTYGNCKKRKRFFSRTGIGTAVPRTVSGIPVSVTYYLAAATIGKFDKSVFIISRRKIGKDIVPYRIAFGI